MLQVFIAAVLLGTEAPPVVCNLQCEQTTAAELIEAGEVLSATARLKEARDRFPEDRRLRLLLARCYLLQGNLFWAERTLRDAVEIWPRDPELRSRLAAVHLRQGDPELAQDDLKALPAPEEDPLAARWLLLEAAQSRLAGDPEAASAVLAGLTARRRVYPEDRQLWAELNSGVDPWWSESITGTFDVGLGHTSNALAGSPTDPGASGDASSLGLVELRSRLAPPLGSTLRPVMDLEILGHGISEEQYRELSSLQGSLRFGAQVVRDTSRWTVGYRAEGLWLNQDSPLFSKAHRLELELEWVGAQVLFAGVGHREYEDEKRTRWEADLGFGGPLGRNGAVPMVAGGTIRFADAESPAYDQLGLSAAISTQVGLGRNSALRFALSGAWDDYPNSGGEEGLLVFGTEEKRRDLLARARATLWAPVWHGLRPGVELRYSRRYSTADEAPGFDFSYREWRAVAWLRISFSADPWAPRRVTDTDRVPLDWGLASDSGMDDERILDILRRDEELRRGSSCAIP